MDERERWRRYARAKWRAMTPQQKREKRLREALALNPLMKPCIGCVYVDTAGIFSCAYILREKHPRPCPPGEGCEVKRVKTAQHDKEDKDG